MSKFKVMHCLRAPVGGLFRHVRDLVTVQAQLGNSVGVICDANSNDQLTTARLEALEPHLELGLHLVPMERQVGRQDFSAYREVRRLAEAAGIDVLHGHGAKGGAYARLAAHSLKSAGMPISGIYTPHGGSLHYSPSTPQGQLFKYLERILCKRSDAIVFESEFSQRRFAERIGRPACASTVVPNGLTKQDFAPRHLVDDAADILYVGEMRDLKGVDTLIEALAILNQETPTSAVLVGDGPDRSRYIEMVANAGLAGLVELPGAQSATEAFTRGKSIVVPSRAESFPYIVLEAAAAKLPLIATNVGGIPEIVRGTTVELIEPGKPQVLADAIRKAQMLPERTAALAEDLHAVVEERYSVERMAIAIQSLYARTRNFREAGHPQGLAVNQA